MATETTAAKYSYELFVLFLCVFALGVLTVEAIVAVDPATRTILDYADVLVCALFLVDFVVSFTRAPNRWRYLYTWGWIDLLSSIPMLDPLRWGRIARMARIFRVLRAVKATRIIASFVLDRRSESALLAAALISILLVVFSSIAMLHVETGAEGINIKTAEDALWWAFATVTTVGYGDRFPVTSEGRFIAVMLMTAGVGLFGTFSGLVAAWFLAPGAKTQETELEALRQELAAIKQLLDQRPAPQSSVDLQRR